MTQPLLVVVSVHLLSVAVVRQASYATLRQAYVFATIPAAAGAQPEPPVILMQTQKPVANVCVTPPAAEIAQRVPCVMPMRDLTLAAYAA